jgi:hypothetical protein
MLLTALQKLGASTTTPTAIRHGPFAFGGLNLLDLRTELGICQIRFLRQAIYSGSEVGNLILFSIKYTQIEAGIPEPILERPDKFVSYITPTWITSLRQFLYTHNITITLTDTLQIFYSATLDQCIIATEFLNRYTPQQKRTSTWVRLHLQAITLSDLSDPDGNTIRSQALQGFREGHIKLCDNWPRQDQLIASQRRLWTRYISSTFLRYDRHWKRPLGDTRPGARPRSPWLLTITPIMCDALPVVEASNLSN